MALGGPGDDQDKDKDKEKDKDKDKDKDKQQYKDKDKHLSDVRTKVKDNAWDKDKDPPTTRQGMDPECLENIAPTGFFLKERFLRRVLGRRPSTLLKKRSFKKQPVDAIFSKHNHPKRHEARNGKFVVCVGSGNPATSVYPQRGAFSPQDRTVPGSCPRVVEEESEGNQ